MKTGRISGILCPRSDYLGQQWFSTTFGVRVNEARRQILDRETRTVRTRFGGVEVKIGRWHGRVVTVSS